MSRPQSPRTARSTRPHRAARYSAALLAAGLLLPVTGCSDGAGAPLRAAGDVSPAERLHLRSGGTVRWAVDAPPQTFNVFQADADEAAERIAGAVLPSLFTLDERGRPQANPDYLLSAEVVERSPKQTVVYRLNPRARWSDGEPVSVEDFQAQWHALNGKDAAYWTARNAGYERIESVSPGGKPGEVRVVFSQRYADWESLFTPLYPQRTMSSPEAFNTRSRTRLEVSAGPFAVKQRLADAKASGKGGAGKGGAGSVTLVRNDAWWGKPALLDRLVFTAVPQAEREAALRAGTVEIAEVGRDFAIEARRADAKNAGRKNAEGKNAEGKNPGGADAGDGDGDGKAPGGAVHGQAGYGQGRAGAPNQRVDEVQVSVEQMRRAAEESSEDSDSGSDSDSDSGSDSAKNSGRTSAKKLDPATAYTLHRALEPAYTQLALNGSSGPLADEQVRRAVARAVDRASIARGVLDPLGLPGAPLGSHLLMSAQDGYADRSAALGRQDVQAAQALIAEAGFTGGPEGGPGGDDAKPGRRAEAPPSALPISVRPALGVQYGALAAQARLAAVAAENGTDSEEYTEARKRARAKVAKLVRDSSPLAHAAAHPVRRPFVKDGKPLTLRFVVPGGAEGAPQRDVAARIVRMLDAVGVRTTVVEADGESYLRDYVASGDYDLALYSWPGTAYPATDARPIYAKPVPAADGSLVVERNYTRVGTDEIDRLFAAAGAELDSQREHELLAKADARIWAAAGSVPLYQRPELVAVRKGLHNAGAFGFATPRYQDIGYRR
ncbi:ABC transporter family substrate-binding protein [Streptomyces polyrhachis]|uniref:ABC transporter family substrate-binding protein n=1 Tax=Streptomyces polyrhachis TaxID=1282885 RepID=A0ABW2GGY1_9ACTN